MKELIISLLQLAVMIGIIAGFWKVFEKAGKPGWASIIPFYNVYVMLQIAGRPGWWLILLFIPLANFAVAFVVLLDIAKKFGKGVGYAFGLLFLGFIFFPILGFGDATYRGERSSGLFESDS